MSLLQKADLILANSQLDPDEALPLYQKAQDIFEALVKQDTENTVFQRGLSVSFYKLASVYEASKNYTLALANMKLACGQIVRCASQVYLPQTT
ncbi:hypothetical protein MNBD_GAMMA15-1493 [hydrothermal vent metagenome]|uniref:Uncharacterized protein n=1 Tax=hydrothermal vent metagenome TaxID=652676 RepID=A0A3B0YC62_9ZZZZ